MACEMCGSDSELVRAQVEGAILNLCKNCASYGIILEEIKKPEEVKKISKEFKEEIVEAVVGDYSEKIRKAREKRGLTQEQLAKDIGEKESVIHNLESGHLKPNDKLIKKLEQFFQISLVIKYKEENEVDKLDFKNDALTIGDLLKIKNEQKKS